MNKSICLIAFFLILNVRCDAFFEFIETYGKRNNKINEIILNQLDTQTKKWKRSIVPVRDSDGALFSAYIPTYESKENAQNVFTITQFDGDKRQPYKNGNDLFKVLLEVLKTTEIQSDYKTKKKTYCEYKINMIPINGEMCFERYLIKQDVSDSDHPGTIELVEESAQEHLLTWVVDLGHGCIRHYVFSAKNRLMSREEKEKYFSIFKAIEERIREIQT